MIVIMTFLWGCNGIDIIGDSIAACKGWSKGLSNRPQSNRRKSIESCCLSTAGQVVTPIATIVRRIGASVVPCIPKMQVVEGVLNRTPLVAHSQWDSTRRRNS